MDNVARKDLAGPETMGVWRSQIGVNFAPLAIAALIGLINLATPTADYFWDGITFAFQIEKVAAGEAHVSLLFHQNHLLYNALGYLLYVGAHGVGADIRALGLLQALNMILGAGAAAVFFKCAERITRNSYAALVCSIGLAFCASWWKLATDANAYIPAVFFVLLCFNNLSGSKPRWHVAGLLLASAMLVHELSSLFFVVALVSVAVNRAIAHKARFALLMSGAAWSITAAVYYACAALIHGMFKPFEVIEWAASNPSRSPIVWNPIPGILTTPNALFESVIGHRFALFYSQRDSTAWITGAIAIAAIASCLFIGIRKVDFRGLKALHVFSRGGAANLNKPARRVCAVWLFTYLVFRCFFEPQDPYHRVFFLPALALALATLLADYWQIINAPTQRTLVGLRRLGIIAPLALGLFNLAFFILPNTKSNANRLVEAARAARTVWDENTIVYFAGHSEVDTTFQYFNPSTKWRKLSVVRVAELQREAGAASARGATVWLNSRALSLADDEWIREHPFANQITVDAGYARVHYVQLEPHTTYP